MASISVEGVFMYILTIDGVKHLLTEDMARNLVETITNLLDEPDLDICQK